MPLIDHVEAAISQVIVGMKAPFEPPVRQLPPAFTTPAVMASEMR